MYSILTLVFLSLLGILTLFLVLRSVFALIFGLYILFNLAGNGLLKLGEHLGSSRPAIASKPGVPASQREAQAPVRSPRSGWGLVTQCLIWGNCESRQGQK